MKENDCKSDPGLPCPNLTLQHFGEEPEQKWAELHCPELPAKSWNPALLSNSSLCLKTKGNQGQKEKSRRLPEKESYCIRRNIFCINRKEKKKSVLENTCVLYWSHSAPRLQAEGELWAGGKSPSHIVPCTTCFLPYPVVIPCLAVHPLIPGSPYREPSQLFHNYRMIYLEKQLLLSNFHPCACTVQPSFTWGCFWQPGIPVPFLGPSLLEEWTFPKQNWSLLFKKGNSILVSSMSTLIWSKIKWWFPHLCKSKTFLSGGDISVAVVWLIK